jgi:hypothetical protein
VQLGPFAFADKTYFSQDGKSWYFYAQVLVKGGGNLLTFSGKAYGPWSADAANRIFDLEAGIFALEFRTKDGSTLQVNDKVYGPYQSVELLRAGEPGSDQNGRFFGFVATLKDGRKEVHVQGGATYGPYKNIARTWISPDGKDWLMTAGKEGSQEEILLSSGVEQETQGAQIQRWAGGYLVFDRVNGTQGFSWKDGSAGPYSGIGRFWMAQDGLTWAAEAYKGDGPGQTSLIVVNGREYPGERLRYVNTAMQEYFTWFSYDADRNGSVNVLKTR